MTIISAALARGSRLRQGTAWAYGCAALLLGSSCGDGNDAKPVDAGAGETAADDVCNARTPHGCYVAQADNHAMCPARSPEQSASYPPTAEWMGCNGIEPQQAFGLDKSASCTYLGPHGELATCLCDTGLHWLCSCGDSGAVNGIGTWPDCTTP
jgi:hypothetical protein